MTAGRRIRTSPSSPGSGWRGTSASGGCRGCWSTETQGFLDRAREPQAYARGLARVAGQYLNELHGHHNIEDHHYFPMLKALDARIALGLRPARAPTTRRSTRRSTALAEAANAVLAAVRDGDAGGGGRGGARRRLAGFGRMLDRHLTDEEELVVPVILDHPGPGSDRTRTGGNRDDAV